MTFPTIPTVAAGRVLSSVQADTSTTRTFPSLTGLTKNAGDLLIAICVAYQTGTGTNAAFSGWGGGFTEFHDSATTTTLAMGAAYKWSTGSETGTFTVTQAGAVTGHAVFILLSIPGAHQSTPPEAGGRASGTAGTSSPASFDPSGWATEDTLWINVAGNGETATAGSWTGVASTNPTNYTDAVATSLSGDAIGTLNAAVAFRQLAASSEDAPAFTHDTSNVRDGAFIIAVRPAALAAPTARTLAASIIAGPTQQLLTWNVDTGANPAPTYTLEVSTTSAVAGFSAWGGFTALSTTSGHVTGLTTGVQYWLRLVGTNSEGSATSNVVTVTPATFIRSNTFEGIADETALTTGNAGSGGNNFDQVASATADTAIAYDGTVSVRGTTTQWYVGWRHHSTSSRFQMYARGYYYFPSNPSSVMNIGGFYDNSGFQRTEMDIYLSTAGKLRVQNTGGTEMTAAIALNQWIRIEFFVENATDGGDVTVRLYNDPLATTPTEELTRAGSNPAHYPAGARFGNFFTGTFPQIWVDAVVESDVDWIGRIPIPVLTNQTVGVPMK